MPVNFSNFAEGSPPTETDQVVGYSVAASGGERRWTLASLRSSLIKGAASTIDTENLPISKALISTNVGKVGSSTTTATEISYLAGARSNIQQQIDSSIPSGAVMPFAGTSEPNGWLICDGRPVSRSQYNNLFIALGSGTIYGTGNNSTTFNLPDLRGYFVRGSGTNSDSASTTSGAFGAKQAATVVPMGDPSNAYRVVVSLWNNVDNQPSTMRSLLNGEPGAVNETSLKIIGYQPGTIDPVQANAMVMTTRPANIAMLYCIKI